MGGSFRSDDGGVVLFVQGVEEWFFLRSGLGEVGGGWSGVYSGK